VGAQPAVANGPRTLVDQIIRMSDGVSIVADVTIPEGDGPFPVILMDSPYGRFTPSTEYADDGYVHVNADVRGTGRSGGVNCIVCTREQRDVYELVEWAGRQSWSNGNVGMMGGSYLAFLQLLGAALKPPSLKAIVPRVAYSDLYRDDCYQNGLFSYGVLASFAGFQPTASASGTSTDPLLLPQASGRPNNAVLLADCKNRPFDGPYYRERSIYNKLDQISVPTLFIGGWFDPFLDGTTRNFNGVASKDKRLILGPWTHHRGGGFAETAPEPYPDVHLPGGDPVLSWFDHHLKGIDNGVDRKPAVEYYDIGDQTWKTASSWPPTGAQLDRLYLSGAPSGSIRSLNDGSLTTTPPRAPADVAPDSYRYDPTTGLAQVTSAENASFLTVYRRNDQRMDEMRGITYTTPSLTEPLVLNGRMELEMWASTTGRDTDWVVKVADVHPDGTSLGISAGYVRASHREVDERMSTPGAPWLLNTSAAPVPSGQPLSYRVPLAPVGLTLAPGHRLRVAIYSADPAVHEPLLEPATNTVLHDRAHPAVLRLTTTGKRSDTAGRPGGRVAENQA
jgi:predicted acyl esterase